MDIIDRGLPVYGAKHWSKERLAEKYKYKYKCGWCGYEFIQYVGKYECSSEAGGDKGKKNVSSQVQCQQCKMFIPTWEGKKKWKT